MDERRESVWGVFRSGDLVRIAGHRGAVFRFHAHVIAPTGEWIEVYGGRPGRERWRSLHLGPDMEHVVRAQTLGDDQ